MPIKENIENKLVEKYGGKSPQELEKEQEDLESQVSITAQSLEQNISKFSSKTDEMKDKNGTVLAVVKRPTSAQFRRFVPPELVKYKDKPESVSFEVADKYESEIYKLMEELIVIPKHTAQEWRERVGDEFTAIFQAHLFHTRQNMSESVKSFL